MAEVFVEDLLAEKLRSWSKSLDTLSVGHCGLVHNLPCASVWNEHTAGNKRKLLAWCDTDVYYDQSTFFHKCLVFVRQVIKAGRVKSARWVVEIMT